MHWAQAIGSVVVRPLLFFIEYRLQGFGAGRFVAVESVHFGRQKTMLMFFLWRRVVVRRKEVLVFYVLAGWDVLCGVGFFGGLVIIIRLNAFARLYIAVWPIPALASASALLIAALLLHIIRINPPVSRVLIQYNIIPTLISSHISSKILFIIH